MSDTWHWAETATWPPQCCVAAFLVAALKCQGSPYPKPEELPLMLGTRVSIADENPLGLSIVLDEKMKGVSVYSFIELIGPILNKAAPNLAFRYLPFSKIPLGLYEEFLSEALEQKLTIGIGVEFSALKIKSIFSPAFHILRILEIKDSEVILFDDSKESSPPLISISWELVEAAALAADSGFWILGLKKSFNFKKFPFL
jgi:hypothetical protein